MARFQFAIVKQCPYSSEANTEDSNNIMVAEFEKELEKEFSSCPELRVQYGFYAITGCGLKDKIEAGCGIRKIFIAGLGPLNS